MAQFFSLLLSGLVTGALYSIMASGLVLTYTTSGVFNFAQASVAFSVAYMYYQLHSGVGIPLVPAAIISVLLFAPLLGLLLDRLVMRRLAGAPIYARIVGTVALSVALPNLLEWLVIPLGINVLHVHGLLDNSAIDGGAPVPGIGPTPPVYYHLLHDVVLTSDQFIVFVAAALAAVMLWYVLRRTRLGLEMRAVVDRDSLAGLRGINSARTSRAAWIMTTLLAGLGGVLIAPLFSLDYDNGTYTIVVLSCLAVVVLGRLRSIPIAFVGGLLLGVVQDLVVGYGNVLPSWLNQLSGFQDSIPWVLLIIALLVFGRRKGRQAGSIVTDAPAPDHRIGMSAIRRRLPWVIFVVALLAFSEHWLPVLQAGVYAQTLIATGLGVSIILLSFVVVTGIGGMVNLAIAGLVTMGGLVTGWALNHNWGVNLTAITTHGQLNYVWAAVLGIVAAAVVGFVISLVVARLDGLSLAFGTLAFAFIGSLIFFALPGFSNGTLGWNYRQPVISIPGLNWLNHILVAGHPSKINTSFSSEQIVLFLAIFGLITLMIHALQRSASGRAILAVRSSEVAASASGIHVNRHKVLVFTFASAIAGAGGVLVGLSSLTFTNSTAVPLTCFTWLIFAVLFGIRRPGGALIAGLVSTCLGGLLQELFNLLPVGGGASNLLTSPYFLPILSGFGAIQVMKAPDGILAMAGRQNLAKRRAKQAKETAARIAAVEAAVHGGAVPEHEQKQEVITAVATGPNGSGPVVPLVDEEHAKLHVSGVVAGYGEVEVLHGVDLAVEAGQVVALLGANGAGKSTLCAVVAGTIQPSLGRVWLNGEEVSSVMSFQRARNGLLVVPESRGIFPGLTVEENLTIMLRDGALRNKACDHFPILAERYKQMAGSLSGGEQQMLSLVPALVQPPAVLIADEPTLGLAPLVAGVVMDAILKLRELGTAVLLVEEHAQNALKVADRIAFMSLGRITWCGPRDKVDMALLMSAYLGEREEIELRRAT